MLHHENKDYQMTLSCKYENAIFKGSLVIVQNVCKFPHHSHLPNVVTAGGRGNISALDIPKQNRFNTQVGA